jgi:hypothetical protein
MELNKKKYPDERNFLGDTMRMKAENDTLFIEGSECTTFTFSIAYEAVMGFTQRYTAKEDGVVEKQFFLSSLIR